jgi:hypothetical protein
MDLTDEDLAVRLLRATPSHENRHEWQLRGWAMTALAFGDEMADTPDPGPTPEVVERDGGVRQGAVTLAEYETRRQMVIVYMDAISFAASVFSARGWEIAPYTLRAAAIAHETAHHRLRGSIGQELNRRLDFTVARLGRWRLRGHVAGVDEIVAHRFAHRRAGLERSALQLTDALRSTFGG